MAYWELSLLSPSPHLAKLLVLVSPGVHRLTLGVVHGSHAHLPLVWEQVKDHTDVLDNPLDTAGPHRLGDGLGIGIGPRLAVVISYKYPPIVLCC